EVTEDGDTLKLGLGRGTKPSDGDKKAAQFEKSHPGYTMVDFDPYLGHAVMKRLKPEEIRARAVVAAALRFKPWEVKISSRSDGGYSAELPKYQPSQHAKKIEDDVVPTLGQPGWYWEVDARTNRIEIIPGELPTFAPAYPYPVEATPEPLHFPLGVKLGGRGEPNSPLELDLEDNSGALINGLAGSGKS